MSEITLRLATRRSALALTQARAWGDSLRRHHPSLVLHEVQIVTTGDKITDRPLQQVGGKGLFLKEIEEALVNNEADCAVHSMKDVPAELAEGLRIAAVPPREDPRDALISRHELSFDELPRGARVGTSSLRRRVFLHRLRPDLELLPLRGNVDTRLRKLDAGEWDAIVLAYAGLRRLGLAARATEVFDAARILPAIGQGALGIECRLGDHQIATWVRETHDETTALAVAIERGFMMAVGGSCQLPVAGYAEPDGTSFFFRGMFADAEGNDPRFLEATCPWPADENEAAQRGIGWGKQILAGA